MFRTFLLCSSISYPLATLVLRHVHFLLPGEVLDQKIKSEYVLSTYYLVVLNKEMIIISFLAESMSPVIQDTIPLGVYIQSCWLGSYGS